MGKAADSDLWYVHAACLYGRSPVVDRSPRRPKRLLPKI
jgi:hypothetical protein